MTEVELRNSLFDALEDLLGTYTLTNGSEYPAIWVGPQQVPNSWTVAGLECVIQSPPEQDPQAVSLGAYVERTWTVVLTQRDSAATTEAATQAVIQVYPVSRITTLAQSDKTFEQVTIRIMDRIILT